MSLLSAKPKRILGCVVCFNPDPEFYSRINSLAVQVDSLVVMNNGSRLSSDFVAGLVIENANIGGIAGALNRALMYAFSQGFDYIAIFDQDSEVPKGLVGGLVARMPEGSAAIGPCYVNSGTKRSGKVVLDINGRPAHRWMRSGKGLSEVYYLINSGTVLDLRVIGATYRYDESLSIDCVDMDFCLTLKRDGLLIFLSHEFFMSHGIGNKMPGSNRLDPPCYSIARFEGICKSRALLVRKWFRQFPYFISMEILLYMADEFRNLLLLPDRLNYFFASVKGYWQGLSGRR